VESEFAEFIHMAEHGFESHAGVKQCLLIRQLIGNLQEEFAVCVFWALNDGTRFL
jgi:hypothetical protein